LKELGYAQCEAGHARDAIRTFEGMLEARDSTPVQMSTMLALGCLGEAYLLAGEFDRAQSTARQALDMNAGLNPIADATAWRLLGRIALAQGETAAGHQRLMMALNAFEQCGSSFEAARTRLDLAKALASRGERNGISEQITAAIQAFDAAGAPLRTAQAVALADQI